MHLHCKTFPELSVEELFEIYRIRTEIFVVEQNCPYQEVDAHDKTALHLWLEESGRTLAYLRVLPAGSVFDTPAIGRVLVNAADRRRGLATRIVRAGIESARTRFHADAVTLEAQTYARSLYEKLGFVQTSDEFLEDGIPHIRMQLNL